MVIVACKLIDDEGTLAVILRLTFLVAQFTLLHLDTIFLGQVFQCLEIGDLLMFHNEVNRVASLATGKALTDVTSRRDRERRRTVVMEWTQAHIVDATFAQRDEIRHHIHYLGSIEYPIYSSLVNHIRCESTNKPANTQVKYQIIVSTII